MQVQQGIQQKRWTASAPIQRTTTSAIHPSANLSVLSASPMETGCVIEPIPIPCPPAPMLRLCAPIPRLCVPPNPACVPPKLPTIPCAPPKTPIFILCGTPSAPMPSPPPCVPCAPSSYHPALPVLSPSSIANKKLVHSPGTAWAWACV